MSKDLIEQIRKDIENYEEAIRNAEGALAEAERELQEELIRRYNGLELVPDLPE